MNYVYFSASGTTQKVISILSDAMGDPSVSYDLLRCPPTEQVLLAQNEPAIFAFPVFGGRLPQICPVGAISADNPRKTDTKKCIACTACITACPQHARGFHVPVLYSAVGKSFAKSNSDRKEPEIFL